jgi:hypothetical protein
MSLSNELSSEIAEALLSPKNRSQRELKDLQEVVFRIHSVLRQMDAEARLSRQKVRVGPEKSAAASNG